MGFALLVWLVLLYVLGEVEQLDYRKSKCRELLARHTDPRTAKPPQCLSVDGFQRSGPPIVGGAD